MRCEVVGGVPMTSCGYADQAESELWRLEGCRGQDGIKFCEAAQRDFPTADCPALLAIRAMRGNISVEPVAAEVQHA